MGDQRDWQIILTTRRLVPELEPYVIEKISRPEKPAASQALDQLRKVETLDDHGPRPHLREGYRDWIQRLELR